MVIEDVAKKNVRHLRLSNTSLKVLLGSCDNSAHRLSYRYHSNRDVTSQYFPMKACVAKQLAVRSGKIQGCFLADESYICVCLCVCMWRNCLCCELNRNPIPPHFQCKTHM